MTDLVIATMTDRKLAAPVKHRLLRWCSVVHSWSSLLCTLILLAVCITGPPLVFHAEIDGWLDDRPAAPLPAMPANTPRLGLDRLVAAAHAARPGMVVRSISLDGAGPILHVTMGDVPEPGAGAGDYLRIDTRTGAILPEPPVDNAPPSVLERIMDLFEGIHTELLVGETGEIVLAVMGVPLLLSLLSGTVLYAPFMQRLRFGAVRDARPRTRWLDLHNLLGIVTLVWMLVIGATGAFNSLEGMVFSRWLDTTIKPIVAAYPAREHAPVRGELASVEGAIAVAERAQPRLRAGMVVLPNQNWVSPHHYMIWMYGQTPATSKMRLVALVDAVTGELTAADPLPWYMQTLDIARPLHFGDYGGLPLKIIWFLLDLVMIVVLVSGLYLWISRRKWRIHDLPRTTRATAS